MKRNGFNVKGSCILSRHPPAAVKVIWHATSF